MGKAAENRAEFEQALANVEKRLRDAGATVSDALLLAGLDRSTYYRWRDGSRRQPYRRTWERLLRAVDKLTPNESRGMYGG